MTTTATTPVGREYAQRNQALGRTDQYDTPKPKLADGALYLGDNGRAMCSEVSCAGATALYTGRDLSGQRVYRITQADIADWKADDPGVPLECDCGSVRLA